jgi:hypothetical protein
MRCIKEGKKENRKRMERAVKGDGRFCDILHVRNILYLPLKRIGRKRIGRNGIGRGWKGW